MGYTRVYINIHKDYDYSIAQIQRGWIEGLWDYIREKDWLFYEAPKRITIMRRNGSELNQFMEYLKEQGCTVFTRDSRSDQWDLYCGESE